VGAEKAREMARDGEEESDERTSSSNTLRVRARPDPFLVVCRCFRVITAAVALLCIGVNVLSAIRSFKDESDVLSLSLSLYVCVCVCVCVFSCMCNLSGFVMVIVDIRWDISVLRGFACVLCGSD
jgi:hypothetical protein